MPRNICVTAVDGQTGFLIAKMLLTNSQFSSQANSIVCLSLNPESLHAQELVSLGASVVPHHSGQIQDIVKTLKDSGCDTMCLVPPVNHGKLDISTELAEAAKCAQVPNVLLISWAACDQADPKKQPQLREFVNIETLVLKTRGLADMPTGTSPCIIR